MRIGLFFGLVNGELDLVGMEFQGDSLEVFLDECFTARSWDTENLEGVVDRGTSSWCLGDVVAESSEEYPSDKQSEVSVKEAPSAS